MARAATPRTTVLLYVGMLRLTGRACAVLLAVCVLLLASPARAGDRIDRLADQLANGDDFRVRTQAALALGASRSKRAVEPLCSGLEDANTTVRAAAAAGLGKLKLGGKDCLEKRLPDESSSAVKSAIKKALQQIQSGAEPAITSSTRYYVAIGKTTDKTGRSGDEIDGIVHDAMARVAVDLDGYVVAPRSETPTQAKQRLAHFKSVKAFYLTAKVLPPRHSGGSLTVKVELAIFTYPGKALKGTLTKKLTQSGVDSGDSDAENELIKMAAQRAMQAFAANAERLE